MKRLVVVTGAAGGIGYATVELFVEQGWEAIGVDIKEPEAPVDGASFIKLDLADPAAIEAFADVVKAEYEHLHALVNNAAMQVCKPLVEVTAEDFDISIATNLRAVFLLTRHLYPLLKACEGAVVNTASVHSLATSADISPYAASKGGVLAVTRSMAIEFAPDNVRANAVLPGAINTPMLHAGLSRGHVSGGTVEDRMAELGKKTVIGRVGEPEEIAHAIYFLADPEWSSFVTGHGLVADGGALTRLSTE